MLLAPFVCLQGLFGSGNANDATMSALGAGAAAGMPVSAVQRQVMLQQMALSKQSGMQAFWCADCADLAVWHHRYWN